MNTAIKSTKMPPNITASDKVILFDGVCKLCNGWSKFIIHQDTHKKFKLASVQSAEGQQVLAYFNYPLDKFDTMLLVEGNRCYSKSDAFINVMRHLSYPWKMTSLFKFIPTKLRNWLYDRIALNRYTLFGKYDQCLLPTPDHNNRFLKERK